ncbi:hypothetical protein GALL_523100 [mine drainage metagenome]|uniref:Uncharacterized protein n=1 Tax=mine drainage metagenome TaxID=410659 RepID=A0A1J5PF30_9ZZZZ
MFEGRKSTTGEGRLFALPPGTPFNRLNLDRDAQINVDPFVLVRVPARKRHCCYRAVFADTNFQVLIVRSCRGRVPTGEMIVLESGVNGTTGLLDSPGNIRHKMPSEFRDSPLAHFTQPLLLRNPPRLVDQAHRRPNQHAAAYHPSPLIWRSLNLAKIRRARRQAAPWR